MFGSTPAFGTPAPTAAPAFGASPFGAAPSFPSPSATPFGATSNYSFQPTATTAFSGAATPQAGRTATLKDPAFGALPEIPPVQVQQPSITPIAEKKAVTPSNLYYKLTPRSGAKIKPRSFTAKSLFEESSPASPASGDLFVSRKQNRKLLIDNDVVDLGVPLTPVAAPQSPKVVLATPIAVTPISTSSPVVNITPQPKPAPLRLPIIEDADYEIRPQLDTYSNDDLSRVREFTVSKRGVGSVQFHGETDVRDLLVNDLVIFEPSQLTVYPDESIKPEEGQGLNKPATVSPRMFFPRAETEAKLPSQNMSRDY